MKRNLKLMAGVSHCLGDLPGGFVATMAGLA